jgi:WD40 repeat protein
VTRALLWVLLLDANAPELGLDPRRFGLQATLNPMRGALYDVAASPDGRHFAVACQDRTVRAYEFRTGRETGRFEGHAAIVRRVAFSPDGRRLAAGADDGSVRIWEAATGAEVCASGAPGGRISALAFTREGHLVLARANAFEAQVLSVPALASVGRLSSDGRSAFTAIRYSASGERAVTTGHDGARVWQAAEGRLERKLASSDYGLCGWLSRSGTRWVSGGADGRVKVWDLTEGNLVLETAAHQQQVYGVALTRDGRHLVTAGDGVLRLAEAATGREVLRFEHPNVFGLAMQPDGRRVVTIGGDRQIRIWGPAAAGPGRPGAPGFLGAGFQDGPGAAPAVLSVVPESPAEKAGLEPGDRILAFDGRRVRTAREALEELERFAEGQELVLEVERDGRPRTVSVKLGKRPERGGR